MTNLEKHEDIIKLMVYSGEQFAVTKCDGEVVRCGETHCRDCKFNGENTKCCIQKAKWMQEEYKEPKVDWSKVPIDTPILVRDYEDGEWKERYFAGYIGEKICAFDDGWTSKIYSRISTWQYAKLAETESN